MKAAIPVTKRLAYDDGLPPPGIAGKFTFTLSAKDGAPMPEAGATVTNPGSGANHDGGAARFGQITFTRPGIYTYLITESGLVENVANDAAAGPGKTVTVTVTDDLAGSLKAVVSGADATDSAPTESTTFENAYSNPPVSGGSSTVEPAADKPSASTPFTGDSSAWIAALSTAMLIAGLGVLGLLLIRRKLG